MLGLGLSIPQVAARGSRSLVAAIRSLFAANEPGVWYDPSDFRTMFQDAAGTTPVTAVEQPVGLMLDKSKGLVLGPELVTNGDFSNGTTGWVAQQSTIQAQNGACLVSVTGVDGRVEKAINLDPSKRYLISADLNSLEVSSSVVLRRGVAGNYQSIGTSQTVPIGQSRRVSFIANPTGSDCFVQARHNSGALSGQFSVDNISVRELPGNHAYQTTATSRPVLSARVNQYLATETLATQNVATLAAQYRLSFEGAGTVTLSGTATGVYSAGSHLITCTAGTLTSTVSGSVTKADLRATNMGIGLPAYQRVNTETDYDTVGFPHYLRFDGVDDWLVTNTITPGIDKAQVFAGVRKLSDTAAGMLLELGTGDVSGSFQMFASGLPGDSSRRTWVIGHKASGLELQGGAATFPAPDTRVLTGSYDLAGTVTTTQLQLRLNTAPQSLVYTAFNPTTGNYLAYPLYIGRRGGATVPFNGHLYSLIVRFGYNLPTATIEKTEKYINTKTRAY